MAASDERVARAREWLEAKFPDLGWGAIAPLIPNLAAFADQECAGVEEQLAASERANVRSNWSYERLRDQLAQVTQERDGLKAELEGAYLAGADTIADLRKVLDDLEATRNLLSVNNQSLESDLRKAHENYARLQDVRDRLTQERDEAPEPGLRGVDNHTR